jgi:hypothetical protein
VAPALQPGTAARGPRASAAGNGEAAGSQRDCSAERRRLLVADGRTAEALRAAGSVTLDNPAVTDPNPAPPTCFDGSETRVPSGYTKGRHLRMAAFSRSIASSGNHFEHRVGSRSLRLGTSRDILVASTRRRSSPILPKTLGCLCVSPRLG